ncbi:MAG TPA: hypothetical protein VGJ88_01890 [Thermoanaerobaculia bacterium]|jgi:short-subunit dehydrogenase
MSTKIGRPIVHTEPWAKVTVVLLDRHVAYLDDLAIHLRQKHRWAASRAELIRGLIEAAASSNVDILADRGGPAFVQLVRKMLLRK